MEFPPETSAASHTIAFHAVFAPRSFFFGTRAESAGQNGKLFWYVKDD
jgi:hypothetical protein